MKANKRIHPTHLIFIAILVAAFEAACVPADEMKTVPFSETPPCTPFEGSPTDPCEPDLDVSYHGAGGGSQVSWADAPSLEELVLGRGDPGMSIHLVLRGTVIPDASRCAPYPNRYHEFHDLNEYIEATGLPEFWFLCHLEVRTNDYYIGEGPGHITVTVHNLSYQAEWFDGYDDGQMKALFNDWQQTFVELLEGREMVMFIGPSPFSALESWVLWHVAPLESDGGEVMAVRPRSSPGERVSLTQFETEIDTAHESRVAETDGRISLDPDAPALVGSIDGLTDYLQAIKAYDDPVVTPAAPPAIK